MSKHSSHGAEQGVFSTLYTSSDAFINGDLYLAGGASIPGEIPSATAQVIAQGGPGSNVWPTLTLPSADPLGWFFFIGSLVGQTNPNAPDCPNITKVSSPTVKGVTRSRFQVYNASTYPLRINPKAAGSNLVYYSNAISPGGDTNTLLWYPGQTATFTRQVPGGSWLVTIDEAWTYNLANATNAGIDANVAISYEQVTMGTKRFIDGSYPAGINGTWTVSLYTAKNAVTGGAVVAAPWTVASRWNGAKFPWAVPAAGYAGSACWVRPPGYAGAPSYMADTNTAWISAIGAPGFQVTYTVPPLQTGSNMGTTVTVPFAITIQCARVLV